MIILGVDSIQRLSALILCILYFARHVKKRRSTTAFSGNAVCLFWNASFVHDAEFAINLSPVLYGHCPFFGYTFQCSECLIFISSMINRLQIRCKSLAVFFGYVFQGVSDLMHDATLIFCLRKAVATASLMPLSPSAQIIKMSFTPRFFSSFARKPVFRTFIIPYIDG